MPKVKCFCPDVIMVDVRTNGRTEKTDNTTVKVEATDLEGNTINRYLEPGETFVIEDDAPNAVEVQAYGTTITEREMVIPPDIDFNWDVDNNGYIVDNDGEYKEGFGGSRVKISNLVGFITDLEGNTRPVSEGYVKRREYAGY